MWRVLPVSLPGGQARCIPEAIRAHPQAHITVRWPSLLGFLSDGVTPRCVTPKDLCEFCSLLLPLSSGVLA